MKNATARELFTKQIDSEEGLTPIEKILSRSKLTRSEFIVAADIGHATYERVAKLEAATLPAKILAFLEKLGEDPDFFEKYYKVSRLAHQIDVTRRAKKNIEAFEKIKRDALLEVVTCKH